MKATIFDIERNSFVDGPGIRTTVFFKGCNLRCAWCHNPESQNPNVQMMFYADKCIGCGKCESACLGDALTFYGKEKSARTDKILFKWTLVASIVFAIAVLLAYIIQPDYANGFDLDAWQSLSGYGSIFQ